MVVLIAALGATVCNTQRRRLFFTTAYVACLFLFFQEKEGYKLAFH